MRNKMLLTGLFVLLMNSKMTIAYDDKYYLYFCPDYHPQTMIRMDLLTGIWYVVEIFEHNTNRAVVNISSCPIVNITRESKSDLRLVWNEKTFSYYYHVRIHDLKSPGFWLLTGPFNESSTAEDFASQFTGTIQVMKAVGYHMVLTFCKSQGYSKVFTALLSRERFLPEIVTNGVMKMLMVRSLDPMLIKHTCNSVPRIFIPGTLLVLGMSLIYFS